MGAGMLNLGLVVVYMVVFVSFFDNHSLLPIIAPYARSLGASLDRVGLIVGAYSAINLLGNLGAGYWIDRVGRKTPLVAGLFIVAAVLGLYPLAHDPSQLLVLRIFHGLGAALASPASLAYIGDTARPSQHARAMAIYGAVIGLTVLVGPPLAGLIRDRLGYAYVFGMLASLMLGTAVLAFLCVTESLTRTRAEPGAVPLLLRNHRLSVSYSSAFCLMFSLGSLIVFLPLMAQELRLTSGQTGLLFTNFALAAIMVQLLPLGRLSDRWGRQKPIVLGLSIIGVALVLLPLLGNALMLYAAMFLYGIGFGFLFPAMTALIADETRVETRGIGSGFFTAVYSLGVTAGTMTTGVLVWLEQVLGMHPFQSAAVLVAIGIGWALVALSPHTGESLHSDATLCSRS
jgi:DHA1 family multidrug resistance protein-like MFS transporter